VSNEASKQASRIVTSSKDPDLGDLNLPEQKAEQAQVCACMLQIFVDSNTSQVR